MNHSDIPEMNRESLEAEAKEYLEKAKYFKDDCQFRLAIESGEKAVALYHRLEMWEQCIDMRQLVEGILYAVGTKPASVSAYLEETLQLAQNHLEKKHSLFATIFYHFAEEYKRTHRIKLAGEYYHKSLEIRKITDGEDSFHVGLLYGYIGYNLYAQNNHYDGIATIEKGLAILENVKDSLVEQVEIDRSRAKVHVFYGRMLYIFDSHEKGLFHLNRALDIVLKIGNQERVLIGDIYSGIELAYSNIGEYDKGLLFCKKALHEWQLAFGEKHYLIAQIKVRISAVLVSIGAYEEAIKHLEEAIPICENSLEVSGEQLGYVYTQFNRIYKNKGNHGQAFIYIKKSLEINTQFFGEKSIQVAHNEYGIGEVYRYKKEYEKALKYHCQSLAKSIVFGRTHYINSPCKTC